jgi:hypothetical protein
MRDYIGLKPMVSSIPSDVRFVRIHRYIIFMFSVIVYAFQFYGIIPALTQFFPTFILGLVAFMPDNWYSVRTGLFLGCAIWNAVNPGWNSILPVLSLLICTPSLERKN